MDESAPLLAKSASEDDGDEEEEEVEEEEGGAWTPTQKRNYGLGLVVLGTGESHVVGVCV